MLPNSCLVAAAERPPIYIFRNAKPDGLTIGNVGTGLVANAVLGSTGVEYDIDKLVYLGAANSTAQYVFNSVAKLGLDSIDKLRARSGLRVGAQTVGHDIYINGRLFSWLLGLNCRAQDKQSTGRKKYVHRFEVRNYRV